MTAREALNEYYGELTHELTDVEVAALREDRDMLHVSVALRRKDGAEMARRMAEFDPAARETLRRALDGAAADAGSFESAVNDMLGTIRDMLPSLDLLATLGQHGAFMAARLAELTSHVVPPPFPTFESVARALSDYTRTDSSVHGISATASAIVTIAPGDPMPCMVVSVPRLLRWFLEQRVSSAAVPATDMQRAVIAYDEFLSRCKGPACWEKTVSWSHTSGAFNGFWGAGDYLYRIRDAVTVTCYHLHTILLGVLQQRSFLAPSTLKMASSGMRSSMGVTMLAMTVKPAVRVSDYMRAWDITVRGTKRDLEDKGDMGGKCVRAECPSCLREGLCRVVE